MRNRKFMFRYFILASFALLLFAGASLTGSAQNANSNYRGTGHDPFRAPRPPRPRPVRVAPPPPRPVEPPSIQERINAYRARKQAAMMAQQTPPKPTVALLLSEIQVTGIFRTPRGYAAMVEATPINMSYVVYPGEMFFDGQLVAVEENRLVFRRLTVWSNGRREMTVETKPLRQPNAVLQSLTASSRAGATESPATTTTTATPDVTAPTQAQQHSVAPRP